MEPRLRAGNRVGVPRWRRSYEESRVLVRGDALRLGELGRAQELRGAMRLVDSEAEGGLRRPGRLALEVEQVQHPHGRLAEHLDALRVVDAARVALEQDLELRGRQPVEDVREEEAVQPLVGEIDADLPRACNAARVECGLARPGQCRVRWPECGVTTEGRGERAAGAAEVAVRQRLLRLLRLLRRLRRLRRLDRRRP